MAETLTFGKVWLHRSQPGRIHFMLNGQRRYVDPSGTHADADLYRAAWQAYLDAEDDRRAGR